MRYPWWRLCVFLCAASVPVYWLYLAWTLALGPDPGKVLVDNLGHGALVLLLLTLAMTPLQRVTGGRLARCAETAWTLVLQLCIAASR